VAGSACSPGSPAALKASTSTEFFAPNASRPPHAAVAEQMPAWYQFGEGGSSIAELLALILSERGWEPCAALRRRRQRDAQPG
jgi:hypothetical protein